jgi:hypothetical protein
LRELFSGTMTGSKPFVAVAPPARRSAKHSGGEPTLRKPTRTPHPPHPPPPDPSLGSSNALWEAPRIFFEGIGGQEASKLFLREHSWS